MFIHETVTTFHVEFSLWRLCPASVHFPSLSVPAANYAPFPMFRFSDGLFPTLWSLGCCSHLIRYCLWIP